jgi:glycosyltransferase involved in cell wall biosynthesis/SAM-dependent methyltransferase
VERPLVSVVIPCYNHGRYLHAAVASVKKQTYSNTEIIVVDDGSSDDTKIVAESLSGITYVYQENRGLSAARNTGIHNSTGEYFVFLDADDYLYPRAIEINLKFLLEDKTLAFVSGAHDKVDAKGNIIREDPHPVVTKDHYLHLLQGNYIGMHATVMYTRWVMKEFKFDTSLKACEDYDLYFRITRKYPVANHAEKIAAYRIHGTNMSGNIPFMFHMVMKVQNAQTEFLQNKEEKEAQQRGVKIWQDYYGHSLYSNLSNKLYKEKIVPTEEEVNALALISKQHAKVLKKNIFRYNLKKSLKTTMPQFLVRLLYKRGIVKEFTPNVNSVQWGDLERTSPFSTHFGFDRGGAVDRYYIDKFLTENKQFIKGRAFEIGDNSYTMQYGGGNITKTDVLHVYQANDTVTYVGDLTDAPQIPSDSFDCIILTQTLHLIYDYRAALRTCYRMLKPGGNLFVTVPGITHIDQDEWRENWLWAFTDKSMIRIMEETFPGASIDLKTYGNVYIATAFIYGLGLPEIKHEFLDVHDPCYQVIIAIRATK